jgi:hypothetical protein
MALSVSLKAINTGAARLKIESKTLDGAKIFFVHANMCMSAFAAQIGQIQAFPALQIWKRFTKVRVFFVHVHVHANPCTSAFAAEIGQIQAFQRFKFGSELPRLEFFSCTCTCTRTRARHFLRSKK